ncbi:MAG TPA: hypothetical protein VGV37_02260 [Aliidongia sp.]|uniref:hypothetical protein n=1 Tax=Aliidongia sp. TaxID=1914230 RepID=UPI002DDCCE3D|nr:hypothetical protein [Aliidongia sp.]HEV2673334.1 hypothetical protein [Aliidongia sp.]
MSPATEWPAEPWARGQDREAECLFQAGEMTPLVLADPSRTMTVPEVDGMLDRIVACVDALAGIEDPAGFVAAAKRLALGAVAADAQAEADFELGEQEQVTGLDSLRDHLRLNDLATFEAAAALRDILATLETVDA